MVVLALGLAGVLVAAGLSVAAFALAGKDLRQPIVPGGLATPVAASPAAPRESPEPHEDRGKDRDGPDDTRATPTPEPSDGAAPTSPATSEPTEASDHGSDDAPSHDDEGHDD
jgi:hypothetical protein